MRTKFNQAEWAKVIGLVAAGSRLGSMGSSLLYGYILRAGIAKVGVMEVLGLSASKGDWRIIFKVSAIIQVRDNHCLPFYSFSTSFLFFVFFSSSSSFIHFFSSSLLLSILFFLLSSFFFLSSPLLFSSSHSLFQLH